MLTQGTKLFGGLSVAAIIGLMVYGFSHNFTDIGGISLWFLTGVLVMFTAVSAVTHDANVSAMDDTAVRTAPNTLPPASPSLWPFVAAAGGGLTAIGLVTDKRYFIAGIVFVGIALFEWTVAAWADRASADSAFNGTIRGRLLNPVEFPIGAAFGLGVLVFSFSRLMLTSNSNVAPLLFGIFGAVILFGGLVIARSPRLRKGAVVGVLSVASLGVAGVGVWAASNGQNPKLTAEHHEAVTYAKEGATCDAAPDQPKDKNADGAVAAKSSLAATFTYNADGTLTLHQFAGSLPGAPLTVDRGNPMNILFRNDHPGEFRLRIYAGLHPVLLNGNEQKDSAGNVLKKATQFCTALIPEGKTQLLTFTILQPSVYNAADPFYAEVPGATPPAKVDVVVP